VNEHAVDLIMVGFEDLGERLSITRLGSGDGVSIAGDGVWGTQVSGRAGQDD